VKKLDQANDYFRFPVGNASSQGNHLSLRYTETGTKYWTVEYINPHSLTGLSGDLTAINEDEYWNVSTPGGGRAIVNIRWTPSSNLTPLMTEFGIGDMRVAEFDDGNAYWVELASTQTGNNYNGNAETTSKINLTTGAAGKYTLSCINQTKPRIRLDNSSPICGDAGIPVLLSAAYTIYADYTISYTLNGTAQTPLTVSSFPAVVPTLSAGGTYQLTGFTYNNPAGTIRTGAVDVTAVTAYAVPTVANAGSNQSLCGATGATLDANGPYIGTGLWSIVSGTGGTVITPTDSLSDFNGTNGSTYTLRWTITNGTCISSDDVVISFPLLAEQPENFTSSSSNVCREQSGIAYTVPNDPSVTYTWTYTGGTGITINGTGNSVTIDFDAAATSGTLSVTATNTCGTSDPRTVDITVNPLPTITLDPATAEACHGAASAELIYTGTANSPNQYSINYEAGAETQGFADIANAALGSSPLTLVVPVAASVNTYNATLSVRNSTTGCVSHDNSFTITVHALPVPSLSGSPEVCPGAVMTYTTDSGGGISGYTWNVSNGTFTGGTTNQIEVTWGTITGDYEDHTVDVNYTDANGCDAASPTELTVRVYRAPVTGPQHHINNLWND
ncbi:MAG: hypothetical protein JXA72_03075, partial [Bacteroidales bacterium]|nr:hypothetical protein [Bacteroidales bacterium]